MKFSKYHGTGNDFILIDYISSEFDYSGFAIKICNRHKGVGADGLMYYSESDKADIMMNYINSDGSIGEMCGNGIRCFVRFLSDNNVISKKNFKVETLAGIMDVTIIDDINIMINMGERTLESKDMLKNNEKLINHEINVKDRKFIITSLLFGVPHTVIEVDKITEELALKYGPILEKNEIFKNGSNINFVEINDENNISVITWERGAGLTLSCGTGSCAAAIVMNENGKVNNDINVKVLGGKLNVKLDKDVFLTGEAIKICDGSFYGKYII
ncbi:diaminopimelate epimerase [Clostridiaceae bacterium HSG29]|nr:diaminopimelate epimerase [Clostridiaceae bacterium HSG29]